MITFNEIIYPFFVFFSSFATHGKMIVRLPQKIEFQFAERIRTARKARNVIGTQINAGYPRVCA